MKTLKVILYLSALTISSSFSQTLLTGKVTDKKGTPLVSANVFIQGSYDGSSTDSSGLFKFKTNKTGVVVLNVSFVGYENLTYKIDLSLNSPEKMQLRMTEVSNELNTVTVTAGTFEASDQKKTTFIKPLDMATTAGGAADVTQTVQLLIPGAQRNGEGTGIFIRGGSAQETKILIDGLTVQNPFNTPVPNVSSRSRFSPLSFKGHTFSTGAYSAQYGQALSAILLMNTTDLASNKSQVINVNLAGISYANTILADDKKSISFTADYMNTTALFKVYRQNVRWQQNPEHGNLGFNIRFKPNKSQIFKLDIISSASRTALIYQDLDRKSEDLLFSIKNYNTLINSTHQKDFGSNGKWQWKSGISFSHNTDNFVIDSLTAKRKEERIQGRTVLNRNLPNNSSILVGAEGNLIHYSLNNRYQSVNSIGQRFLRDNWFSVFAESEIYITRLLAARVGARTEFSSMTDRSNLAPRISVSYKIGRYSQVSAAMGSYFQTPNYNYFFYNKELSFERADNYVLNYQLFKGKRTFRIEGYHKQYADLVLEKNIPGTRFDISPFREPSSLTSNSGSGYANGVDIFFKDSQTIKSSELWINYSYLDTRRIFANYLSKQPPIFSSKNNLNVVYKLFVPKPLSTVAMTYSYTSGRPYYNPNNSNFLSDRTPDFHSVSLWINYITKVKTNYIVAYIMVDNALGTRNVYGYRYSADGKEKQAIVPAGYRMILVGAYFLISSKSKDRPEEILNN